VLLRELVAHQRELLDELREELAARRREVQQLQTLLAQALQRALPAREAWAPGTVNGGASPPPPPAEADGVAVAGPAAQAVPRPWWRFW
jgi:uncharacterized coiled-coil protein SlyX